MCPLSGRRDDLLQDRQPRSQNTVEVHPFRCRVKQECRGVMQESSLNQPGFERQKVVYRGTTIAFVLHNLQEVITFGLFAFPVGIDGFGGYA